MGKITQADLYKKTSGVKRLETAFRLSAMVRELSIANIKAQNPKAAPEKISDLLQKRYAGW